MKTITIKVDCSDTKCDKCCCLLKKFQVGNSWLQCAVFGHRSKLNAKTLARSVECMAAQEKTA